MEKIIKTETSVTLNTFAYSFGGRIKAIASKSHAHRLLIASSLSSSPSRLILEETSKDIEATISCLNNLGATITKDGDHLDIKPIPDIYSKSAEDVSALISKLDAGESGSTLRFMFPIVAALGKDCEITTHNRLTSRPLSPLYEELISHGATLSKQGISPLITKGHISSGTYTIPGNISSQYITGLLFALPLLDGDSRIKVTGEISSRPYINITLSVLASYNIKIIEDTPGEFIIPGNQIYTPSSPVTKVEGDWSNAAFFLCAGAISKENVTVTDLSLSSDQGDKKVIDILRDFGAGIEINENSNGLCDITVIPKELKATFIDAHDIPDLIPILSVCAAASKGTTKIINYERLRIKESDRVEAIKTMLANFNVSVEEKDNTLYITGVPYFNEATNDSSNDHRMAMSTAIASIRAKGPVTITDPYAITKSYPDFYLHFTDLMH